MVGLESGQTPWFAGLLIVWAALLFGGFVFGKLDAARERRMPRWTRITSSLMLVILGWSSAAFARDTGAASYALLIAAGMTLGFLGDLFMAGLIPIGTAII